MKDKDNKKNRNENRKEEKEKIDIQQMYEKYSIIPIQEFISTNNIDIQKGLDENKVKENIEKYGINQIKQGKQKKWYNYLFESLTSPFNLILLGITLVLIYTDVYLSSPPSYANIIVIILLITISTLLEFFEVYNSNKAAQKLKSLVETKTTVLRYKNKKSVQLKVPLNEITIGDIIILSAGDIIPADLRVIESKDLFVTQSSLTGESDSVKKVVDLENINDQELEAITDLDNICFMGTNVTSGYA